MDKNLLVKIIGYSATILHGDPAVFDRWIWLKRNLKSGQLRTLDAGCGSGAFTMYAAKIGNEAIGISFDSQNNEKATIRSKILKIKNVKFVTANLNDLGKISSDIGLFDQIICCETIEHIFDDRKLILNFSNLLKPKGRLLLTAPYKYYKHLYGDDKTGLSTWEDGGHVRTGYTHKEMSDLLNGFGFEVVTPEYITGYISQKLINLTRQTNFIYPFNWILLFPLRILQFLDPLLHKVIHYPFLSIGVIAVKL